MDNVLEIQNLEKSYGSKETQVLALHDLSISVQRGEFVLIVGSSGSGKSTLLNMIGLLDKPTRGKIIIDGQDVSKFNDAQISSFRNNKLGFIFQFSNLLADLTVLENILLPRQIQNTTLNAKQQALQLLKMVGMEEFKDRRSNKLSGGQAQRAAIARGLINTPSIVLADEPTGNLDSVTAAEIVKVLKNMAKKLHQTFIIVTHDKKQFGHVDKIITIKDGKATADIEMIA